MPSRRFVRIVVALIVAQSVLAVGHGDAQQRVTLTTVSMNQEPMRPQEDMEAICRKGEADLAHKEHSCSCEITCTSPDENGHATQMETPGCSTHCHALARYNDDGTMRYAGGCKCHPDLKKNPCDKDELEVL